MIAAPPPNRASVIRTHSLSLALTEKAHQAVMAGAKLRKTAPETLLLAALADYLGRNAKSGAAKAQPFVLHIPWRVRERVVAAARAEGTTVYHFMIAAAVKAVEAIPGTGNMADGAFPISAAPEAMVQ